MPVSVSVIVVSSQLVVAVADRVPQFDIVRSCKLDLASTAGLSDDQSLKSCVSDEKRARLQLGSEWSKFSAASNPYPAEMLGFHQAFVSCQHIWYGSNPATTTRCRGYNERQSDLAIRQPKGADNDEDPMTPRFPGASKLVVLLAAVALVAVGATSASAATSAL